MTRRFWSAVRGVAALAILLLVFAVIAGSGGHADAASIHRVAYALGDHAHWFLVGAGFLTVGTGAQKHRLKSGGVDVASLTQGQQTTFEFSDIPTRNGKLVYYVPFLLVTLKGTLTQSGGTGVLTAVDNFFRMIIANFQITNAWRGTIYNTQMALGAYLPIIEYVGLGYRYAMRRRNAFPAANGANAFSRTFAIPLGLGCGRKPWKTAPLAIELRGAQAVFNIAASTVFSTFSPGGTLTSLTMRVSAVLDPKRRVLLGPGVEWVDYSSPASSSQSEIVLRNFGNTTGLLGTDPDAGVAFLGALSTVIGLGGSFTVDALTRYAFPFRGQAETQQIEALVSDQIIAMGPGRDASEAATPNDGNGFPYIQENTMAAAATQELVNLMFLPQIVPGEDFKLTEMQIAYGDQSYMAAGPAFAGTNHTLAQHARSWQAPKREDFVKLLVDSGIAKDCLGWAPGKGVREIIDTEIPAANIDASRARFLPRQYVV